MNAANKKYNKTLARIERTQVRYERRNAFMSKFDAVMPLILGAITVTTNALIIGWVML